MQENSIIYTLEQMDSIVNFLKEKMATMQIFTFSGVLGAGKTTLIRSLLKSCGVQGPITSPTFTYVNVYHNDKGETLYHFDLYRINSVADFLKAGFDEYLYQPNSWCFIEWPEKISPLLTRNVCHVTLEYHGEHERLFKSSCID